MQENTHPLPSSTWDISEILVKDPELAASQRQDHRLLGHELVQVAVVGPLGLVPIAST